MAAETFDALAEELQTRAASSDIPVADRVSGIIAAIAEQVSVFRQDGEALETLSERLRTIAVDVGAALAAD